MKVTQFEKYVEGLTNGSGLWWLDTGLSLDPGHSP